MRKIIAIAVFISALNIASAQKLRLGLRLAPSLAWLKSNTSGVDSDGSNMGFSYGVITDYNFADNYAIGTGIDISYKGGALKAPGINAVKYELQYLEIPLTLKMKTNAIGSFIYYGQFGFAGNFNLKSNEDINPIGVSMIIGAGIEIPITGKTALTGGLFFNNGFTDIIKGEGKAISNYLGLNIGILF